jgi:hypothetical protein
MGAADEVVTSVLEGHVAPPGLEKFNRLIQIELVMKNLSRKLRVVEDLNERVRELGSELFDGFSTEWRIVLLLLDNRILLPSSWILRILARCDVLLLLILIIFSETERSSSSSRHG